MKQLRRLCISLVLLLALSITAFAGDVSTPGVFGDISTPGVAGDVSTPGIAGDISTPGIAGDILTPGLSMFLSILFWQGIG